MAQHDDISDPDQEDENGQEDPDEKTPVPVAPPARKTKGGDPLYSRHYSFRPDMEAIVNEALKGVPMPDPDDPGQPVQVPPVGPVPTVPRPPGVPVFEPVRNPFRNPVTARGVARARVRAGSANAVRAAEKMAPRAWSPTAQQIRELGLGRPPVVGDPREQNRQAAMARMAAAELVASNAMGQEVQRRGPLRSGARMGGRRLIAGAVAGVAAAGAGYLITRPRGGGGAGLHLNMTRGMRRMVGTQPVRRFRQADPNL